MTAAHLNYSCKDFNKVYNNYHQYELEEGIIKIMNKIIIEIQPCTNKMIWGTTTCIFIRKIDIEWDKLPQISIMNALWEPSPGIIIRGQEVGAK